MPMQVDKMSERMIIIGDGNLPQIALCPFAIPKKIDKCTFEYMIYVYKIYLWYNFSSKKYFYLVEIQSHRIAVNFFGVFSK